MGLCCGCVGMFCVGTVFCLMGMLLCVCVLVVLLPGGYRVCWDLVGGGDNPKIWQKVQIY